MSALRLYTARQTRGARPQWVLEELGIPYELVDLDEATEEQKRRHRQLHPLGRVPALEQGDVALFESAALCLHLADLDPERRLLPAAGTVERAWMSPTSRRRRRTEAIPAATSNDVAPRVGRLW